jgi:putative FmdB family regulatory protein
MPTYEYRCRDCGHTFDIVQKMSDASLTHCPECGGELRKVFAPPAIAFKGSGFYATDHGKKSKRSADTSADKTGDSSEGSGSKKDSSEGTGSSSSGAKEGGSGSGSKKESTSGSPDSPKETSSS